MNPENHKKTCVQCSRKILVMIVHSGISHISGLEVICGQCILENGIEKQYRIDHPNEADEIEKWVMEDYRFGKKI